MLVRLFVLIMLFGFMLDASGQNFQDALRLSSFDVLGTARTVGVGGGLGALGTDFAVMNSNPAGIALNRRSELVFTPALWLPSTRSTFTNSASGPETNKKGNAFFNINNIGFISSGRTGGFNRPKFNFAIGLNRVADFNRSFSFDGSNQGSITDDFLAIANGNIGADFFQLDPFGTFVAEQSLAIYQLNGENFYRSDFEDFAGVNVRKTQEVKESGAINEFVIGVGGNFKDRLMIGLNIGIPSVNFQQVKVYQETDRSDEIPQFEELEFRDSLSTTGTGFNAKLGIIYRFNQSLRAGLAVHTPTWLQLDDVFTTDMDYSYLEGNQIFTQTGLSPEGIISYQLTTPWRVIGSLGFIIKEFGFLSGEIEFVDYSSAKFGFDDFPQDEPIANGEIENELNSAVNIRLGGEAVYKVFRFRAGIGLFQNPLVNDTGGIGTNFSLGAGIRQKIFYIDAAYRLFNPTEETYVPIVGNPDLPPLVSIANKDQRSMFMMTFGLRL